MRIRSVVLSLGFLLTASCRDRGPQEPAVVDLAAASGEFAVGMDPHVLELGPHRAAITMMGVPGIVFYDFEATRSDTVGRRGEGPGEFSRAGVLVSWQHDRLAVFDPVLRRATVLAESGKLDTIVGFPASQLSRTAIRLSSGIWVSQSDAARSDSAVLIRFVESTGRIDTVAKIGEPARAFIPLGNMAFNLPPEYSARDVWGARSNGEIWIARGADNRIDRVDTAGRVTRGTPRPFADIRTVDADRHRFEGLIAPVILDTAPRPIAPKKAPFQDVQESPDGDLWFWLNQPAGYQTELYEVVGRDGTVRGRVRLPNAHKIVAVSATSVYLFGENADGELVVTKHKRPL